MNAPDSASRSWNHGSYQRQLVRFCDFCAYCSEVAGCGTSASLGGHQVSLEASRLACLFKVKNHQIQDAKYAKICKDMQSLQRQNESSQSRRGLALLMRLISLSPTRCSSHSRPRFRFHNLHLGFVLLSWAMRSMQSMMSSSFWSCGMRACVGG